MIIFCAKLENIKQKETIVKSNLTVRSKKAHWWYLEGKDKFLIKTKTFYANLF